MPLWGANTDVEHKPRNLKAAERRTCAATEKGWTGPAAGNDNTSADREVLVAIRDLKNKIGRASISEIYFSKAVYDGAETITVNVVFNELVDVTNGSTIAITSDGSTNPITATATTHSEKNVIAYTVAAPAETGAALTIATQSIAGTLVDTGTSDATSKLINATVVAATTGATITVGASSSSSSTDSYSSSSSSGDTNTSSSSRYSSSSTVASVTSSSSSTNAGVTSSSSSSSTVASVTSSSSSTDSASSSSTEGA